MNTAKSPQTVMSMSPTWRHWVASPYAAITIQLPLLAIVAYHNRDAINPDAISYLRIGSYYASGKFSLVVSGQWSPLLSWLVAPLIAVSIDPLIAGRLAMAISSILYAIGSIYLAKQLRMPEHILCLAGWISAGLGLCFGMTVISPDVLVSALLAFAFGSLVDDRWIQSRKRQFVTGLLFGLAYLAKAVALPIGAISIVAAALSLVAAGQATLRIACTAAVVSLVGTLVAAGPWIAALSLKFGQFTISTAAATAHRIVSPPPGPPPMDYAVPEAGRLSNWEVGGIVRDDWSPFDSASHFIHQLHIIARNIQYILQNLRAFDLLGVGLIGALYAATIVIPFRSDRMPRLSWQLSCVPILLLTVAYLPSYASDVRYMFPAYPFLTVSALGVLAAVQSTLPSPFRRSLLAIVVAGSFAAGIGLNLASGWSNNVSVEFQSAKEIATDLRIAGINGPVASGGTGISSVEGLVLAFVMDIPWYGHSNDESSPDRILASGAKVLLVEEHSALSSALRNSPALRLLPRMPNLAWSSQILVFVRDAGKPPAPLPK